MDQFTVRRLLQLLGNYKSTHGRDITAAELEKSGFTQEQVKQAVSKGLIQKYQVTVGTGAVENRYKVLKDWKSLNL